MRNNALLFKRGFYNVPPPTAAGGGAWIDEMSQQFSMRFAKGRAVTANAVRSFGTRAEALAFLYDQRTPACCCGNFLLRNPTAHAAAAGVRDTHGRCAAASSAGSLQFGLRAIADATKNNGSSSCPLVSRLYTV